MALIINTPVTSNLGIEVQSGYYIRLLFEDTIHGDQIGILGKDFASKAAFKAGSQGIGNIIPSMYFPYNRETDGADIRAIGHRKAKEYLIAENIATESEIQISF